MKTSILTLVASLSLALFSADVLRADTAAEMLEKGIYNEETIGNLDEAIKIYRQVVDVASKTKRLAAQAQYRLGQCLLKQGKKNEATAAFTALVKGYPDQKELVAKAKTHLPDELKLLPAPWKDGERLTLTMELPNGRTIGIVGLGIDSAKADGKDVWKMIVRRFVASGQNEGVSHVLVDKSSNRPLRTDWKHTVLGNSGAVWHNDKLDITTKDKDGNSETKTVEFEGTAYSNDQWFYGMRQLPLKVGYKVTLPLRIAFTGGNPIGLEVTVPKKETIETPVGEFECFRLDTNIAQTFWIADVPQRYVVRFDGGGVTATLSSIVVGESFQQIENKKLGLTVQVPKGWFYYDPGTDNDETGARFRLVSPEMATVSVQVRDKELLDRFKRESLDAWANSRIQSAKKQVKEFQVREGSMQGTRLAGRPAKTFIVDYERSGNELVGMATLAMDDSVVIDVGVTAVKDAFDANRETFDTVRDSVKVR
jgi:hypothetical protein